MGLNQSSSEFSIAAVGDISFAGIHADEPNIEIFKKVKPIFNTADLVVGNLEGPLFNDSNPVFGKCTIRAHTGWAEILYKAGIRMVSLANNHIMDHGEGGLHSTIDALEKAGIEYVGAGKNLREACSPIFKKIKGRRIAFIARTSVAVDSPSYAGENKPGVAFLNSEELEQSLSSTRESVDLVVLLLHWGVEHYDYPSPKQRLEAKKMICAGVDLILGHHPHVMQGVERFGEGIVAYSLGNFIFDDFNWVPKTQEGESNIMRLKLSDTNRKGIILKYFDKDGKVGIDQEFTRLISDKGIAIDKGQQIREEFKLLSKKLGFHFYYAWWKLYALRKEWDLRFSKRASFKGLLKNVTKIRLRHLIELKRIIRNSIRISLDKTTNPYE